MNTKAVHILILWKPHLNKATLRQADKTVPNVDTGRFLGIKFDSKRTQMEHINELRAD